MRWGEQGDLGAQEGGAQELGVHKETVGAHGIRGHKGGLTRGGHNIRGTKGLGDTRGDTRRLGEAMGGAQGKERSGGYEGRRGAQDLMVL